MLIPLPRGGSALHASDVTIHLLQSTHRVARDMGTWQPKANKAGKCHSLVRLTKKQNHALILTVDSIMRRTGFQNRTRQFPMTFFLQSFTKKFQILQTKFETVSSDDLIFSNSLQISNFSRQKPHGITKSPKNHQALPKCPVTSLPLVVLYFNQSGPRIAQNSEGASFSNLKGGVWAVMGKVESITSNSILKTTRATKHYSTRYMKYFRQVIKNLNILYCTIL